MHVDVFALFVAGLVVGTWRYLKLTSEKPRK